MALSGSWTHYWNTNSLTESSSFSVTYPSTIKEGDDYYDKRGTTETMWQSSSLAHSQSYDSVYIKINGTTLTAQGVEEGNYTAERTLTYTYFVFPDAVSKATSGSLIHSEPIVGIPFDFSVTANQFDAAYTDLKTHQGFENLTDVL